MLMSISRRRAWLCGCAIAAVVLAAALAAPGEGKVTRAAGYCKDGNDPRWFAPWAFTAARVNVGVSGDRFELRATRDERGAGWPPRCVWARLISELPGGDSMWIDRSHNGGRTWESARGYYKIPLHDYNGRNYSSAINPARSVVRACGGTSDRVWCTRWVRI
jgi:hypothetical protein